MNFKYLNEMIQYIEENITENIEYKDLARIVGVSEYSLQRIFVFITGISISDYIKNRKLSKAYEELKTTDNKIIDIAFTYGYNSTISFDRAFKKAFGLTPGECRKGDTEYKQFPVLYFGEKAEYEMLNYQIKELPEQEIYCYKTEVKDYKNLQNSLYKIRELYKSLKEYGIHQKLKEEEMYAISIFKNDTYYYYVGSKTKYTSNEKIKIRAGKYAVFKVNSREQSDIVAMDRRINHEWKSLIKEKIDDDYSVEYYVGDNCYICMYISP